MRLLGWPAGDFLERVLEPGVGLDTVHLAGLDQARRCGPMRLRTLVVAGEERILGGELQRADSVLHQVASQSRRGRRAGTPATRPTGWRYR